MKYEKAGIYEVDLTATDDCGNETSEVRQVLVAREIEAGENITLTQDGNTVTISADTPDLSAYATKSELETDIEAVKDAKQDKLTAGAGVTIANNIISADIGVKLSFVDELPQEGEENIIYLVANGDIFDEYIFIADVERYEKIGDTEIDLSDYYTKEETDSKISGKADANIVDKLKEEVAEKQNKLTSGDNITISENIISAKFDTNKQTGFTPGDGFIIVAGQYLPTARKYGNVVSLEGAFRNVNARAIPTSGLVITTLPVELRPSQDVYRVGRCGTATAPRNYNLVIRTNGNVIVGAVLDPNGGTQTANAQEAFYLGCSYIVD